MAPKSATKISLLFLVIAAALLVISSEAKRDDETKMTFYLQDIVAGPNTTDVILTGIPGRLWSFLSFGTVYVADDPITEGPRMNSPEVARAQGISVTSSLDGANAFMSLSIVFTNKEYAGSTLELQGGIPQFATVFETAVVGGTGKFRFAKGFVIFDRVSYDASTVHSVYRCNVTVRL